MSEGILRSINVSPGGVPKQPRQESIVRLSGIDGDRQRDLRFHGGPGRAVCLYSWELIEALQKEGHPIAPGTIAENLTLSGIPWDEMTPGAIVEIGAVSLELTTFASPCQNIAGSFRNGEIARVSQKAHPGWGRLYARVIREGPIRVGDRVRVVPRQR